jgi:hypothetical protein
MTQRPPPPAIGQDEFHDCPECKRRTRHHVTRDRVLVPVLWCLSCFHLHYEGDERAPIGMAHPQMIAAPQGTAQV